jgi:hypothetical protein
MKYFVSFIVLFTLSLFSLAGCSSIRSQKNSSAARVIYAYSSSPAKYSQNKQATVVNSLTGQSFEGCSNKSTEAAKLRAMKKCRLSTAKINACVVDNKSETA